MNIPESVKIGFKDYKINKVDGDVIDGTAVCYGNIKFDDGIINIANKYSTDQVNCTLFHEVIHGIDDNFDIGLSEEQTQKLGKGLYGFIKDNPLIFKDKMIDANSIITGKFDKELLKAISEGKLSEFIKSHERRVGL
ncbi:MAG: hypothetical protein K0S61_4926 [Anaerocolumna sp.]|jgi:hypothetical protein|nr:hypothetical protein [Anaerocolumna sp.]